VPGNVFAQGAYVSHNQFGPAKNPSVDSLQYELLGMKLGMNSGSDRDKIRVVYVSRAVFADVGNPGAPAEPLRGVKNIIRGACTCAHLFCH
jgi:hypothetical protein